MDGSSYIRALNSFQETFAGVSYTNVYTRFDEVVRPPESAGLHTGNGRITNVAIQDICPVDLSEHLALSAANAVGFALAMDALASDGPAGVARVASRGCAQPQIPGLSAAGVLLIGLNFLTGKGAVRPAGPQARDRGGPRVPCGTGDRAGAALSSPPLQEPPSGREVVKHDGVAPV